MAESKSKVFHARFYVRWAMIEVLTEDFETDNPSIATKRAVEWGIERIKEDIADGHIPGEGLKGYYADER